MPLHSTETHTPYFTRRTGSQAVDLFIGHAAFSLQSQADQIERNVLPSQISRYVDHQIAVDACAELCEDQLCVMKDRKKLNYMNSPFAEEKVVFLHELIKENQISSFDALRDLFELS